MQKVRLKCRKILLCYKLFRNCEWHDDDDDGSGGNLNFIVGNSVYEDVNIIYLIQDSGQWLSTVNTLI
jgi:hypothetical protein